ncbi:SHOCT domain-containing protein [Streptomyces sp. YC537]|uniref:SHOCT domain-containing protein n=2 Tax=Streptomyces boluensis TaxID=1775135 RepID=A0A964ULW1_9ACTN|nr:SHOCT domain-containing protein [Streptomyces boluensis]
MARTAVVAGTASAVSGRVQRHQQEKFAQDEAREAAVDQARYEQEYARQPTAPTAPPAGGADVLDQLERLAELQRQGVLTEAEFAAQKARILGA